MNHEALIGERGKWRSEGKKGRRHAAGDQE